MNLTAAANSVSGKKSIPLFPRGNLFLFALVIGLFFLWGMSNNLTDILVQQFKKSFDLTPMQAQLVQTAVFAGYFSMALPMAMVLRKWGYKTGMLCGLILFGVGTLSFWPAAIVDRYSLMLLALFLVGCGSAALETAANPFVAQSGPAESSERRLNLAQGFNPTGSIAGILVGTFFIFSGVELPPAKVAEMKLHGTYDIYLHAELMRVVPTYVTLGGIVLLLGLVLALTRFPIATQAENGHTEERLVPELRSLLKMGQVQAAIFAQFCYCGAQIATWSAFIPYLKAYTDVSERGAGLLLTGNLVALTCGRFLSTALMRWIAAARMMAAYALVNMLLIGIAILHPGPAGAAALMMTSFFMSIMFPTIFALGIKGLGGRAKVAGSLLVMSVVGGAVIAPLLGWIARRSGSYAKGYIVVALCYLVVLAFGLRSSTRKNVAIIASMP